MPREAGLLSVRAPRQDTMRTAADVATAGFVATAIAYGPARMGFGLHLPQIQDDLGLASATAGAISAALFAAFVVATVAASWVVARRGPRTAVLLGCGFALVGTMLVALAPVVSVLAIGVVLAGASAGLCWVPFNEVATRSLRESERGTPLSLVSTGTTLGIATAGVLELLGVLSGVSWRWAWACYVVGAVVAAVVVRFRVPPLEGRRGASGVRPSSVRQLGRGALWPVGVAMSFGLTSSVFLAFAAEQAVEAGGVDGLASNATAGVVFAVLGAAGLVGVTTSWVERLCGLSNLLGLVFAASAASLALLALWPTSWAGLLGSAGLQGVSIMVISAVLSFWTARLFPERASLAFTVVLIALGTGSVIGPAAAGTLLPMWGSASVFLGAAGLSTLSCLTVLAARTHLE